MEMATHTRRARLGALSLVALALAACGGGGGDAGVQLPDNVAVTAQNRGAVARASFAGVASTSVGGFAGIASDRTSPLVVKRAQSAALVARKRIAIDVSVDLCPGGGAADATETDTAPIGQANPGDAVAITFVNCNDGTGSVANGRMDLTLAAISANSVSFNVATNGLSVREIATGYVGSGSGAFRLTLTSSGSTFVTEIVVPERLTSTVNAGDISDTVTLLDGYTARSSHDSATGTTTSTSSGVVASQVAGGFVRVSTPQPLLQFDSEDYPHAGQVIATGLRGKLRATVQSNTQVLIELDTDDDGAYDDGSEVVGWTTLL